MARHGNLPFHLYIKINNKYLGEEMPDGYTEGIAETQRRRAIGNGWTVDVIAHIFGFMK